MTDFPLAGAGESVRSPHEVAQERFEMVQTYIPNVTMTGSGLSDSNPGNFPTSSYHGYPGRSLLFDDFFDESSLRDKNQLFGPGLYTGRRDLAEIYKHSFQWNRPPAGVVRILANHAILIDADSPAALRPLGHVIVDKVAEYCDAKIASVSTSYSDDISELTRFKNFARYGDGGYHATLNDLIQGDRTFNWKFPYAGFSAKH